MQIMEDVIQRFKSRDAVEAPSSAKLPVNHRGSISFVNTSNGFNKIIDQFQLQFINQCSRYG